MTLPYFQKFSKSCCPCPLDWLRGESAAADRYLAHHPEMQQQMEANAGAAAEQYSVLPYKNFC